MKKIVLFSLCLLSAVSAFSQYNCWIQFKDKNGTRGSISNPVYYLSERAIERRLKQNIAIDSSDLPVSQTYIDLVLKQGVTYKTSSKWLNGITVSMTDTLSLSALRALPCVKEIELTCVPVNYTSSLTKTTKLTKYDLDSVYGSAADQIDIHNGQKLHALGYRGTGLVIGVLDGGFYKADETAAFDSLFDQKRMLGYKDFVDTVSDFYSILALHGTSVLSTMAANLPSQMIGTAPDASYWLIRTENLLTEYPVEVDNWVAGIEYADSVGADIINSSLSYTEFDYAGMDYTYSTLNGRTSRASKAATMAARKGMIVVNAAGNDGVKAWHYISVPSDADSILCVGAVNAAGEHASFSSFGPSADGRIKPDVCGMGYQTAIATPWGIFTDNGTSYASPIIAGLCACVWQAFPDLNNMEVIDLMKKYSSLYSTPNDSLGYGIPDVYALYNDNYKSSSVHSDLTTASPTAYFSGETLIVLNLDEGQSTAVLYGISGQICGKWQLSGGLTSTVCNGLPQGIYVLVVTNNSSSSVIRLLKR